MSKPTPEERAAKVYESMGLTCNDGPDWVEWTFRISQQIREAVEIALKNAGDCDGCGVEMVDAFCLGCKERAYEQGRQDGFKERGNKSKSVGR